MVYHHSKIGYQIKRHTHIPTQNQTQLYDINQQDDCERTSSIKAKLVPVDVTYDQFHHLRIRYTMFKVVGFYI